MAWLGNSLESNHGTFVGEYTLPNGDSITSDIGGYGFNDFNASEGSLQEAASDSTMPSFEDVTLSEHVGDGVRYASPSWPTMKTSQVFHPHEPSDPMHNKQDTNFRGKRRIWSADLPDRVEQAEEASPIDGPMGAVKRKTMRYGNHGPNSPAPRTGGATAKVSTRTKGPDFSVEETTSLLQTRKRAALESLHATVKPEGLPSWSHTASKDNKRSALACQRRLDTVKKQNDAICDHESRVNLGLTTHPSYWNMSEKQIRAANRERQKKLPLVFPRMWAELIREINLIRAARRIPDSGTPTESNIDAANLPSSSNIESSSCLPHDKDLQRLLLKLAPHIENMIEEKLEPFKQLRREWDERGQRRREKMLAVQEQAIALAEKEMQIIVIKGKDR